MRWFPFLLCAAALAQDYDIVLRGGRVIDPKNNVDAIRDVAIKGGKVAAVPSAGS